MEKISRTKLPIEKTNQTVFIIIPASNEKLHIGKCLQALINQSFPGLVHVIVSANACIDNTVEVSEGYLKIFEKKGWSLKIIDSPKPGKLAALNRAEKDLPAGIRIYLDADVICTKRIIGSFVQELSTDQPKYACARLVVTVGKSWATRAYGRVWSKLPYVQQGRTGAGLFAVNAMGRARWEQFPDIIADDHFVRLNFSPEERISVKETYEWPLAEGFLNLVKVRRRQDAGNRQIKKCYPDLVKNEDFMQRPNDAYRLIFRKSPFAFLIFALVILCARLPTRQRNLWSRGR